MDTKTITPAVLSGGQLDRYLSISRHMRHKLRREDATFPAPVYLGSTRPYYRRADVDRWIESKAHGGQE